MTRKVLYGIGVSPGIAVGPALVLRREFPDVPPRVVTHDAVEGEVHRLHEAVGTVRRGLEELRVRALERVGPEEAKIFEAQLMMLEDRDFLSQVERLIRDNQLAAERAFEFKGLELRALWTDSGNSQLRDRVMRVLVEGNDLEVPEVLVERQLQMLLEKQRLVAVEGPVREQFEADLRVLTDAEQDSKELKSAKRHLLFDRIVEAAQLPFPVCSAGAEKNRLVRMLR